MNYTSEARDLDKKNDKKDILNASKTSRFNEWDEQRCLSMADEGGISAGWIENRENDDDLLPTSNETVQAYIKRRKLKKLLSRALILISGGAVAVGLGIYLTRQQRKYSEA